MNEVGENVWPEVGEEPWIVDEEGVPVSALFGRLGMQAVKIHFRFMTKAPILEEIAAAEDGEAQVSRRSRQPCSKQVLSGTAGQAILPKREYLLRTEAARDGITHTRGHQRGIANNHGSDDLHGGHAHEAERVETMLL